MRNGNMNAEETDQTPTTNPTPPADIAETCFDTTRHRRTSRPADRFIVEVPDTS